MAKTVERTVTISGTTYRLVRDPDTSATETQYWIERRGTDKTDAPLWVATHEQPMRGLAPAKTAVPTGVDQLVLVAFLESLTGNR